jgi:hypothetical protein
MYLVRPAPRLFLDSQNNLIHLAHR